MQSVSNDNNKSFQEPLAAGVIGEKNKTQKMAEQTDVIYKVVRRNGGVTPFDRSKIEVALTKPF